MIKDFDYIAEELRYIDSLEDRALVFATMAHSGQTRDDGVTPYIKHPLDVVAIINDYAFPDNAETLRSVALLHDVIEDCGVTATQLASLFGNEISDAVVALSVSDNLRGDDKHQAILSQIATATDVAKQVKMADRIVNLGDSIDWNTKRRVKYAQRGLEIAGVCKAANAALASALVRTCNAIINEDWK